MSLKSVLKRLAGCLPDSLYQRLRADYRAGRAWLALWRAGAHDVRSYARGSGLMNEMAPQAMKARIIKSYHRIEKGLALPAPRPGFGIDAIELLMTDLRAYWRHAGTDWVVQASLQVLQAYLAFHRDQGQPMQPLAARVDRLAAEIGPADAAAAPAALGGLLNVDRAHLLGSAAIDFEAFVTTRHSVRQFAERPVDRQLIAAAVRQAQCAPSVCNRQSGQVYVVTDRAQAERLLAFQNGNRGFGDRAAAILVVTSRQSTFHTVGERYQAWIDGGLFAMTLIYALHAQGLGSCCLNWSVEPDVDRAFKQAAGLPPDDPVIMLIAVGHLPEQFAVARSARRPLDEVLFELPPSANLHAGAVRP